MTKMHLDNLISYGVVDCSKLATNWFIIKLCPNIYIYIYIYMGLSYTWCNSTKVTPFLDRRFLRDLTITNSQLP